MAISKIGSRAIIDGSVLAADFAPGTVTGAKLAGSIGNDKLANSAITIGGEAISLGGTDNSLNLIDWQSKVTSDGSTVTTMVAGRGYFVDNSSAAGLVKLPASATIGQQVAIKDYAGNFGTNNLTIQRNSHNIAGNATDAVIKTNRASVVLVYVDSTKGWLFDVESNISDLQAAAYTSATGGTVTTSSNDKIHTFTGDGNFVVSSVGNPAGGGGTVNYLVVAAGGGGGANSGGGSGAGGYRTNFPSPTTGGLSITATTFPVTVGAGGVDGGNNPGCAIGTNGSNSVFSTVTSTGGGYGGSPVHTFCGSRSGNGNTGGSGGGGGAGPGSPVSNSGGAGNTPPVSPSQGNNGGGGSAGPNCGSTGGGGGGAGGAGDTGQTPGSAPFTNMGACGGVGSPNSISASAVYYSGGGGGTRQYTPGAGINVPVGGAGGNGGGGNGGATQAPGGPGGTNIASQAGTANTGGGGGGGSSNQAGGTGGSGIVIVRYKYQN